MSIPARKKTHAIPTACALVLGLIAAQPFARAEAATRVVVNCNDSGAGSLRRAVMIAASGDTIDLRKLTCGRIRLTSGQIDVPQADLEVVGPGRDALSVNGSQASRIFAHTGTGTLRIRRLSMAYGRYETGEDVLAQGGCIYSTGTVELVGAQVHHCTVYSPGGLAGPTNG